MKFTLPRLKDFDNRGNYVLAFWEYVNNKYIGGRLQRPYIIRIMKATRNTKMMGGWIQGRREFVFAPRIFNNEAVARAVIMHEIAHQCTHELSGEKVIGGQKSHTDTWAYYMKLMGQKPNARMDAADSEKLKTKEEIAQINKYKNTKKNIEKTSSHFTSFELKTPMGLCAKIPGGSTGDVVLGRIVCRLAGGKFHFIDTDYRVWRLTDSSLYKVTQEEQKEIIAKIDDKLVLKGYNSYNDKMKVKRELSAQRKMLRRQFGLL